jgi:hypothetical protein
MKIWGHSQAKVHTLATIVLQGKKTPAPLVAQGPPQQVTLRPIFSVLSNFIMTMAKVPQASNLVLRAILKVVQV